MSDYIETCLHRTLNKQNFAYMESKIKPLQRECLFDLYKLNTCLYRTGDHNTDLIIIML